LEQHLSKFFGKDVFTAKSNDWSVALEIPCLSFEHALRVERFIKRMKSAAFIRRLMHDKEMAREIVEKTLLSKPPLDQ
jgi:putative endonuclease